jgi:hypothetical protein
MSSPDQKDFGPVGRLTDLGTEEEPDERPHLHIHHVAGQSPHVVAPSQVPPSRKSKSQTKLGKRRSS